MRLGLVKVLKESFGLRVFATFTLLIFIISLSFTFFFISHQRDSLREALIKKGKLLAEILAYNSRLGVFSENEEMLKVPVEGIFQQEGVLEASVFNLEGKLLAKGERSETDFPEASIKQEGVRRDKIFEILMESGTPYFHEDPSRAEFWSPVISSSPYARGDVSLFVEGGLFETQERIIGFVRITVDKGMLNRQLHDLLVQSVLIGIAFLIIGSGITYLVVKGVTRPLNRLTEGVKTLEKGGVAKKVPIETSDEIGRLARALNDMSKSLRKRERELRESEERYRILNEESPLGILFIDKNGCYRYTNPKFTEIFGYTCEDIPTGREWFRKAYPDREYRHEVIATWIDDQKHHGIGESRPRTFRVTCKNGKKKTIHFKPVTMKSGNQLVICEDVTEKQRLEAQLQRAQKMEAVGTLAGGVAHDLNNILSGLVSYPDLLLMQLPEDSAFRKPIMIMQNSGYKAAAIVQDLLTLARRGVATMEVLNLNEIITEYLKSPEYERLKSFHPHITIKADLNSDVLNISGSRVHLTKTVMNLVSNAAEAIKDGGIISLSIENRHIDKPISGYDQVEEGDYVVLTVSDTGAGIPAEDVEKIFEPFYTKKKMGRSGTGLGMAVVWGTVKDHKGYIDIKSTEGKGTTFHLYFPATGEPLTKDKPVVSPEEYKGKGESILVVDDVQEQRDIASNILSQLGYVVTSVSSGEEAIQYLQDHRADLLILDMIMEPGIDGLDAYRKILEFRPRQKAIIASGFSETRRVKKAQKLGAGQYIRKPYTMEKIGIAVREELDK